MITKLLPHQVFVFGSNGNGFHGAGAAGFAFRGQTRNNWRDDQFMLKAMSAPKGSPDRIGKWAVYGEARGFQVGTEGKSYAIVTVVRPGDKRSYSLDKIKDEIIGLFDFATNKKPELEFLYTEIGAALAGWSNEQMFEQLKKAVAEFGKLPTNVILPNPLYGVLNLKEMFL